MSAYIIASVLLAAVRLGGTFKRAMNSDSGGDIINHVVLNVAAVIAGVALLCIHHGVTP